MNPGALQRSRAFDIQKGTKTETKLSKCQLNIRDFDSHNTALHDVTYVTYGPMQLKSLLSMERSFSLSELTRNGDEKREEGKSNFPDENSSN